MGYKWIGGHGQCLIENKERKKIGREGNAYGSKKRYGKTEEKSGLGMFIEPPHVPDRVKRCCDPERRGKERKQQAEGIYPQLEKEAGG